MQDVFDIGSQPGCQKVDEHGGDAGYVLINVHMSTVPSSHKMGVCLPKKCSQRTINILTKKFNKAL